MISTGSQSTPVTILYRDGKEDRLDLKTSEIEGISKKEEEEREREGKANGRKERREGKKRDWKKNKSK